MTSSVEICNRALSHVRAKRISALTDASNEARECAFHYELERDDLLASFDWVFARARVALAATTNDREDEWGYCYSLPSDMLNIQWVNDASAATAAKRGDTIPSAEYHLEGTKIYTDVEACYMGYTRKVTNEGLFPVHFASALAWRIAAAIAFPISQSMSLTDKVIRIASDRTSEAMAIDANLEIHSGWMEPPAYRGGSRAS